MKLVSTKVPLASGQKIINGYRITLKKTECEKFGYKAGDEFKATFYEDKIILERIEK